MANQRALTKSEIISQIAEAMGVDKKTASQFLNKMTEIALREVKRSGEFTIPGIGKLVKQKRAARMGRNPATGAAIKIPEKTVVKFRVAALARDLILAQKPRDPEEDAKDEERLGGKKSVR